MTTRTPTVARLYPMVLFALFALLAGATLALALPAQAHADIVSGNGSNATDESPKYYDFTIKEATDVDLILRGTIAAEDVYGDSYVVAAVFSTNPRSEEFRATATKNKPHVEVTKKCLWPGKYYVAVSAEQHTTIDQFTDHYSFILKERQPSVKFKKSSGQFTVAKTEKYSEPTPKKIYFKYDSTSSYFYYRNKIVNSNPKVAKVLVGDYDRDGNGYLKITPTKLGKTVVTLKLGPKQTKYTAYVTKTQNAVNVAKGKKVQLQKPIGVGTVSFKSKNPKVVSVTKAGKVTGKNKGKTTVYAKKGKYTYSYTVVVKDKGTLKAA